MTTISHADLSKLSKIQSILVLTVAKLGVSHWCWFTAYYNKTFI